MDKVKFNYTIDQDLNLITNKITGTVRFEDFSEIFTKIVSDPKFKKNMSSIIDVSEADIDYDMTKLLLFYDQIEEKSNERGKCKWAIIINEEINLGYSEIFKTLCEDGNYEISFFTSIQNAKQWILE